MANVATDQSAPSGTVSGFKLGPYTLSWRNPVHYLILWTLATLGLVAIAGFSPQFAILGAFCIFFGTFIGLLNKKRG